MCLPAYVVWLCSVVCRMGYRQGRYMGERRDGRRESQMIPYLSTKVLPSTLLVVLG